MTTVAQALDRLQAAARTPMGGALSVADRSEEHLAPLIHLVEELEVAAPTDARPVRSILDGARRAWKDAGGKIEQLTTRQIRALCWDADHAMEPDFIGAVAEHPELARNRRWIEGLIESYLARWRAMPDPEAAEQVLRRAVMGFRGRSDRIVMYQEVAPKFFSGSAPQWLAENIVFDRRPLDEALKEWRVDQSTGLGQATADAAVAEWTRRFSDKKRNLVGSTAYGWFRQLTQELLPSSLVGPKSIAAAMSALILWEQAEADERIHTDLRTFLLDDPRFGDPRVPNRKTIWDLCEPAARQRAIGWLAKDDLIFFFRFVIRHDPHGRRDFWLRYIENAVDAHVALSTDDEIRLRAHVTERPSYAKVISGDTSAFLMRFKGKPRDIICIEFSRTGNALYIHDAETFIARHKSIRRSQFTITAQLKDTGSMIQRVSHMSNWTWNVQSILARHGVRPA